MRHTAYISFISLIILLFTTPYLLSAPMEGLPISYTQPNGTIIELEVFGDEYYAETRTLDGYTVYFDQPTRTYMYANLNADGSELISSGIPVTTRPAPLALTKQIRIHLASRRAKRFKRINEDKAELQRRKKWQSIKQASSTKMLSRSLNTKSGDSFPEPPDVETTGLRKGLTILVDFPDVTSHITRTDIDNFCNKPGYNAFGNAGSIYDYFYEQSNGKLRYYNMVTKFITMHHPKEYYNDITKSSSVGGRLLVNHALQILIDEGFDFSPCTSDSLGRLHAVNVFFAGNNSGVWARGLWPHKSSLDQHVSLGGGKKAYEYQITDLEDLSIGTFCHENGHLLCQFPDLYDYDYDSRGVGMYSLMSSSGTTHPVSIDAYLRYHAGWPEVEQITKEDHFRAAVRTDYGTVYQYQNQDNIHEYFIINNRVEHGWEDGSQLPDQGLMILHCDENGDNDNQEMTQSSHYEVSVEQADGSFHLENKTNRGGPGDLFHSGLSSSFDDSTRPNAKWWKRATGSPTSGVPSGLKIHSISKVNEVMTFIVGDDTPTGTPEIGCDRTELNPRAYWQDSAPTDKIAVWNRQGGTLNYSISEDLPWLYLSTTAGSARTEADLVEIHYTPQDSGEYSGTISITNNDDPTNFHTISVTLTVEQQPVIEVTPYSIAITGAVDTVTNGPNLVVSNTGGGLLNYTITTPSWCSVDTMSGTLTGEKDVLSISIDLNGLYPGTYSENIVFSSPEATNSPFNIPINLEIWGNALINVAFVNWIEKYGLPINNETALMDNDNDGVVNYAEYITNGNPTNAADRGQTKLELSYPLLKFIYQLPEYKNAVTYHVLDTEDLSSGVWYTDRYSATDISTDVIDGYRTITNIFVSRSPEERKFIKLQIIP